MTFSATTEQLQARIATLTELCATLSPNVPDATLLTTLASGYQRTAIALSGLFLAMEGKVDTSSGTFSRTAWNGALDEICRQTIERVRETRGLLADTLLEEIAIVTGKEASVRTVWRAVGL